MPDRATSLLSPRAVAADWPPHPLLSKSSAPLFTAGEFPTLPRRARLPHVPPRPLHLPPLPSVGPRRRPPGTFPPPPHPGGLLSPAAAIATAHGWLPSWGPWSPYGFAHAQARPIRLRLRLRRSPKTPHPAPPFPHPPEGGARVARGRGLRRRPPGAHYRRGARAVRRPAVGLLAAGEGGRVPLHGGPARAQLVRRAAGAAPPAAAQLGEGRVGGNARGERPARPGRACAGGGGGGGRADVARLCSPRSIVPLSVRVRRGP